MLAHTPLKNTTGDKNPARSPTAGNKTFTKIESPKEGPIVTSAVRKSIGEWEAGKSETKVQKKPHTTPKQAPSMSSSQPIESSRPKAMPTNSQVAISASQRPSAETEGSVPGESQETLKFANRTSEARACLIKAKMYLGNSRNTKTEIKTEVTLALERLFQLVKEAESELKRCKEPPKNTQSAVTITKKDPTPEIADLIGKMKEHADLIRENTETMGQLKEKMGDMEKRTYAGVAATSIGKRPPAPTALHSFVVTATDDQETGDEVMSKIRKAVNAKEGGVAVERIRKAKDRKIIVGCRSDEEREKVKDRIKQSGERLTVENIHNRDPLVILRDVLSCNSDADVQVALRNQNKRLFTSLDEKDDRLEIAYKKRTRNPHTSHIVMRVSPKIWQRLTDAESVLIDLQRIRVADQSPIVQCSLCLGYGHGRRFCQETQARCSHCGGPHMKAECQSWIANATPSCCNCVRSKLDKTEHGAFSQDCPIRVKWDAIARSKVAYC